MSTIKKANRLIHEKSPYLLQHAYNPVDWFPWCDEAFKKARLEDKPIFLSIGYSTCHWCHVMERESFEDEEVAGILNTHFVPIKVDREERPDIDHIYMQACQVLTGHGGWPLTIFLTPEKKPFYAGTYFPKNDRLGMPGLVSILKRVAEAWSRDREALIKSSDGITEAITWIDTPAGDIGKDTIYSAYQELKHDFDPVFGGFSRVPKFPTPHNLYFLLRYWYLTKDGTALKMVEKTLDSMRKGGIYDHIGFGFCRYSTDGKWLVPHFEKMLYDNALLAIAYLEAYQVTGKETYKETARQIFTYVLRDMTSREGGFYSAQDADSEGMEGRFYLWTPDEVEHVLGKKNAERFCRYYDITPEGNFEGLSIPNLIAGAGKNAPLENETEFVQECREKLFQYREKRVHPHKDDKILTAWNGLMIAAMAAGGRILEERIYSDAAERAAEFIFHKLVRQDGRLQARYRDKESAYPAYVDDYSFMVWGLLELYAATFKPVYLQKALALNDDMLRLFWDNENGGLFFYGNDSEQLITRPKEIYDGAMPSGNSVAALNLLKLARLTGRYDLEEKAMLLFKTFGSAVIRTPRGYPFLLTAFMFANTLGINIVVVGKRGLKDTDAMIKAINQRFRPFATTLFYCDELEELRNTVPYIEPFKMVDGKATAYICENFSCQAPINDIRILKSKLETV